VAKLEDLRWVPRWVSHLGCIEGCLDYLGLSVTPAWLYGATGHAFVINLHEEVCPSGPTAWNTQPMSQLGRNIGYKIEGVSGIRSGGGFAETQRQAWDHVRAAIDRGLPCYGWELDIPEYYVVFGYDDMGYYFSGPRCDAGRGPKAWSELGNTGIGVVEMYSVEAGQPADDVRTVQEALTFALEHAMSPEKWVFPEYRAGLAGYDRWIRALEGGTVDGFGMAYNAGVWCECRGYAILFLRQAKKRLDGRASASIDEAIQHYEVVHDRLRTVAAAFPFPHHGLEPEHIKDPERVQTALFALRAARDAEAAGLATLEAIVGEL
jgi:hypothetical protein